MAEAWTDEGGPEAFLARLHHYIDPAQNERRRYTEIVTSPRPNSP